MCFFGRGERNICSLYLIDSIDLEVSGKGEALADLAWTWAIKMFLVGTGGRPSYWQNWRARLRIGVVGFVSLTPRMWCAPGGKAIGCEASAAVQDGQGGIHLQKRGSVDLSREAAGKTW